MKSKDDIASHKGRAVHTLDSLLDKYIENENSTYLKKADLISYWLEEFSKYIEQEEDFDPGRIIRYKRGNVIRVNFGFRVGAEFGGLHYAVVIENKNDHKSKVITVVPLSSTDGKCIRSENVDLGTELYQKVRNVQAHLAESLKAELTEVLSIKESFDTLVQNSSEHPEHIQETLLMLNDKIDRLEKASNHLKRYTKEIERMKSGSQAIMNQIITVSKQRIYVPKRSEDFLYGVSLSPSAMDKINEKLKERFIFM